MTPWPRLGRTPNARRLRRSRGIVLAIVLMLIFVLVTAVYAFQRRALVDTAIAANRLRSAEAEALARGGLRIGEAVVFLTRLKAESGSQDAAPDALAALAALQGGGTDSGAAPSPPSDLWTQLGHFPLDLGEGRTLRVSIEDENARLNLNALVEPAANDDDDASDVRPSDDDEAEEYLFQVLEYIIKGIDVPPDEKIYDARAIARNLLDYMDADDVGRSGRDEDGYYRRQDPPYSARNGPFLSFDEIGLVEGVDPQLLEVMRDYLTIYPIGDRRGINLNRAEPWVLSIVYAGPSGERELVREVTVRDIWKLRKDSRIVCTEASGDDARCISPNEIGNGELAEGSIYPEAPLPANPSVFRVVAEATVGDLTRTLEAIYDTRPAEGPQLLSWRRLRGSGT